MKVLKFGGTSVGTVESLLNVKAIVESQTGQVIVVVSALGGVTNQLIAMTELAGKGNHSYNGILAQVEQRHLDVIAGVVPQAMQPTCRKIVKQFTTNLQSFYDTLAANQQLPEEERDMLADAIVCHGEIMSSAIVTMMIGGAEPAFSPNFIKTRDAHGERMLDAPATERLIVEHLGHSDMAVRVIQGFIAADAESGIKTNLGRGGSDFTAALVAAALNADSLEIWTDVDGFYDKDPRTHADAQLLAEMTYGEAQRLCDAGAKVIYAPTLRPVAEKHIPVWVKNTFNPQVTGTVIR
ncbi:MAG: aspartate kinase [Muribaculaceae bacterium]|nr:aspartate kinase [Muribaculaceae bacterium]